MLIIHMKSLLLLHNSSMIFFIILSFYQVHQVLKFCYISKASQNFIFCYFCNVQVSLSLIKFFVNTKRFKKLLYCNMENLNSILNRKEIYCYIIEEIIGLKLPDYQFMKYINILRIPLLWLSIQQIFQLLYVPYICISIKKKIRYKIHITCRSRKTQIVIHSNYAYYTYVQTWN